MCTQTKFNNRSHLRVVQDIPLAWFILSSIHGLNLITQNVVIFSVSVSLHCIFYNKVNGGGAFWAGGEFVVVAVLQSATSSKTQTGNKADSPCFK